MERRIETPLNEELVKSLRAGDNVLLSGVIYTARDAAHKRLVELLEDGKELPMDIRDGVIYYVGPTPAKEGEVIGSAGPTTSYRMDSYTPALLNQGLRGMIGKGVRNGEVIESMKENGAVYFGAIGGAAALIGKCVESSEVIAYEDLGAEAIRRLVVKDFPLIVVIDAYGGNLYDEGRREYLKSQEDKKENKIIRTAKAGTLESSDIYIVIMPNEEEGIEIQLQSVVKSEFGKEIENSILSTLEKLKVKSAKVIAQDRGALDYTIVSRVETAVKRAISEV